MKSFSMLLAIFLTLSACETSLSVEDKETKKFVESLEGQWKIVSRTEDGNESPKESIENRVITFKGNKYILRDGDDVIVEADFTVDASKTPVWFDSTTTMGGMQRGVIQIKDDVLSICLADARPKEFTSKKGSDALLIVYKKKKDKESL